MPDTPRTFSAAWDRGDRVPLPWVGDERQVLTSYLEWHRQTFALKCADLSAEQLSTRALPPSKLTLHGLLRHLAGVERWWFRIQYAGEKERTMAGTGQRSNLRRVLVHLLAEYARHTGAADLLRQRLDGAVGY